MSDQPSSDRFKTEMPQVPGISPPAARPEQLEFKPLRLIGFLTALVVCLLAVRWILRPKTEDLPIATPAAQIDVPPPPASPSAAIPNVTEAGSGVASVSEMAKPWSSREFLFRNRLTGESVPALLIRLSSGSPAQPSGYWALVLNAPFGNCRFEYVNDIAKLRNDYGYAAARHPMVGNPCTKTVFDPLKMTSLPGSVWVRGSIEQGSDLRPPLGIEVDIQNKEIVAVRME
jgi:hypothetical protein